MSPQVGIIYFNQEAITFYWPNVNQLLDAYPDLWEGMTKEYIWQELMAGRFQLWGLSSEEMVYITMVTSVDVHPNGARDLHIQLVFGAKLQRYVSRLEEWMDSAMRILECQAVTCRVGRPAWIRVLKRLGFEVQTTVMRRGRARVTLN